jgi:hypothetical protein
VTLEITRVDPAAECEGLVPDPTLQPTPVTVVASAPAGATCLGGSGDGSGHLATGFRSGDTTTWVVFAPDGGRTGEASGRGMTELIRQAQGWHAVLDTPLDSPFRSIELVRLAPQGSIERRTPLAPPSGFLVSGFRLAEDPSGGSVIAAAVTAIGGNHSSRTHAFRFDASGAPAHPDVAVMSDTTPVVSFLGAGASRRSESFVSYRLPGEFHWTWLDPGGAAAREGLATQVEIGADDPVLVQPLLDGGVAVRFGPAWRAVIPHLGSVAAPAPAWLAARSGTLLRFTRGNRGYAVLPPAGERLTDCSQVVELRSPSGTLCGRITLREGSGACTGGAVEQGWDGTLIKQSARDACAGSACSCTVHAWPRLLAGP